LTDLVGDKSSAGTEKQEKKAISHPQRKRKRPPPQSSGATSDGSSKLSESKLSGEAYVVRTARKIRDLFAAYNSGNLKSLAALLPSICTEDCIMKASFKVDFLAQGIDKVVHFWGGVVCAYPDSYCVLTTAIPSDTALENDAKYIVDCNFTFRGTKLAGAYDNNVKCFEKEGSSVSGDDGGGVDDKSAGAGTAQPASTDALFTRIADFPGKMIVSLTADEKICQFDIQNYALIS
jgi:hypothetical protein